MTVVFKMLVRGLVSMVVLLLSIYLGRGLPVDNVTNYGIVIDKYYPSFAIPTSEEPPLLIRSEKPREYLIDLPCSDGYKMIANRCIKKF